MANKTTFYLDEDIVITVPFRQTATTDGYRPYILQKFRFGTTSYDNIYEGKVFVQKGQSAVTLYFNDILQEYSPDYKNVFKNDGDILIDKFTDINTTYSLYFDGKIEGAKQYYFDVLMCNRYANKSFKYPLKDDKTLEQNAVLRMGNLIPHIPNIETDNFSLPIIFSFGYKENSETVNYVAYPTADDIINTDISLDVFSSVSMASLPLSTWLEVYYKNANTVGIINEKYLEKSEVYKMWVEVNPDYDINFFMQDLERLNIEMTYEEVEELYAKGSGVIYQQAFDYDSEQEAKDSFVRKMTMALNDMYAWQSIKSNQFIIDYTYMDKILPIAIVDDCPARYYLKWVDRFGGVQCQGFDGKFNFKSNYERSLISNNYKYQRNINSYVANKWTLNSGYITEDDYIIYESLNISPYIQLYDTEQDRTFDVLVENTDYTEKHYKNEKKMLNFNITVVENKKQKYTY